MVGGNQNIVLMSDGGDSFHDCLNIAEPDVIIKGLFVVVVVVDDVVVVVGGGGGGGGVVVVDVVVVVVVDKL